MRLICPSVMTQARSHQAVSTSSLPNYLHMSVCPLHREQGQHSTSHKVWPIVPWGPQDSFMETHEIKTISIIIIIITLIVRSGASAEASECVMSQQMD